MHWVTTNEKVYLTKWLHPNVKKTKKHLNPGSTLISFFKCITLLSDLYCVFHIWQCASSFWCLASKNKKYPRAITLSNRYIHAVLTTTMFHAFFGNRNKNTLVHIMLSFFKCQFAVINCSFISPKLHLLIGGCQYRKCCRKVNLPPWLVLLRCSLHLTKC